MSGRMEHEPHGAHQTKKAAASGWIGSALEYYDFSIYASAAALIFPQVFFPSDNPQVAIIASLATYGVGYIARPIGAFFLGHWGDTHGRKTVLLLCMFLMGFSTMAVAFLPTYQQAGMLAPILLVVLRLIQGFAVAGEISGASSMILEHAPFGRRGYYASFSLQGVQAGQILAAAVFLPLAHYLPDEAFRSWGWRIPFFLSFVVIVAGYIIRREVAETPAFAEEGEHGDVPRTPIIQAFKYSWKDMLRVVCMALMNVIPVVATIFGGAYAVQAAYGIRFDKDVYLWIPVLGNIVAVIVIPYVGNLPDRIGRRPPVIVGALGSGFFPELFPTRTRVTAMAISQNLGTTITALLPALFATVAPPGSTNIPLTIGAITFAVTIIAAVAVWSARETYRIHLNDLGDPDAVAVDKRDYDRMRTQTLADARPPAALA
jgi:MFS family permease